MAHAQNPDFIFQRKGRVHFNRRGRQFSPLLAAEVCASAVVMLHTPCSEVVWRVLSTHSIHQFPLHFPSRASTCAITFQLDSTLSYPLKHARTEPAQRWCPDWCYHTQRRATVGRTPPDEWSVRRRALYLTTHNTYKRETSMPRVGFEPTISEGARP